MKLRLINRLFIFLMVYVLIPITAFAGSISGTVTESLGGQTLEGIYISVYDSSFTTWSYR